MSYDALKVHLDKDSMNKLKPIALDDDEVRELKQTGSVVIRRVIKPQPDAGKGHDSMIHECPYGLQGDVLWVQETFADIPETFPGNLHIKANATEADLAWFCESGWKWQPPSQMPRWASQRTVRVKKVVVELERGTGDWLWAVSLDRMEKDHAGQEENHELKQEAGE